MTAAKIIESKINLIEIGSVFRIGDLRLPQEWWENVRVKLSRMVKKGKVQKLSNGKFFKPRQSIFGELMPNQQEIIKDLLYDENGRQIGYLTGYSVWNDMGLTTQVANTIVIGSNVRRNPLERGFYSIRFVLQPNNITKENTKLLQILDTIKDIKKIPDTSIIRSVEVLKSIIGELKDTELKRLIKLSYKYQPRIKALLGSIVENIGHSDLTHNLYATLIPSTKYKLGLAQSNVLLNKNKWNIE